MAVITAEKMREYLETHRNNQWKDKITDAFNALAGPSSVKRATVPEHFFVNLFLPLFAGVEELKYKVNFGMWVNVAGGYRNPVDVVDERNNVLYTVPALLNENVVDLEKRKGPSVSQMMATMEQLSRLHPAQGIKYLFNTIAEKEIAVLDSDKIAANYLAWDEIFKRYGYPPLSEKKLLPDSTGKTETSNTNGAEVEGYDLL